MRTGPAGWPLLRDGDGQGHGAVGEGVPSSPQARGFILRPALSAAHHVAGCGVLQCVGAAPGPGSGGTDRSPKPLWLHNCLGGDLTPDSISCPSNWIPPSPLAPEDGWEQVISNEYNPEWQ